MGVGHELVGLLEAVFVIGVAVFGGVAIIAGVKYIVSK